MKDAVRRLLHRALGPLPHPETLMEKVARFVACEMIEGDYLEFGTYRGATFIDAYRHLSSAWSARALQDGPGSPRLQHGQSMRFFAFDSFQGLPELSEEDRRSADFAAGQYACSEAEFRAIVQTAGMPIDRVSTVPGWFAETCTPATSERLGLRNAAVVWLDADLYSSTRTVLEFLGPLLVDGTILVFDDWFSYRGSPYAGVQKAFHEWEPTLSGAFTFQEYQRESWKRIAFIASAIR